MRKVALSLAATLATTPAAQAREQHTPATHQLSIIPKEAPPAIYADRDRPRPANDGTSAPPAPSAAPATATTLPLQKIDFQVTKTQRQHSPIAVIQQNTGRSSQAVTEAAATPDEEEITKKIEWPDAAYADHLTLEKKRPADQEERHITFREFRPKDEFPPINHRSDAFHRSKIQAAFDLLKKAGISIVYVKARPVKNGHYFMVQLNDRKAAIKFQTYEPDLNNFEVFDKKTPHLPNNLQRPILKLSAENPHSEQDVLEAIDKVLGFTESRFGQRKRKLRRKTAPRVEHTSAEALEAKARIRTERDWANEVKKYGEGEALARIKKEKKREAQQFKRDVIKHGEVRALALKKKRELNLENETPARRHALIQDQATEREVEFLTMNALKVKRFEALMNIEEFKPAIQKISDKLNARVDTQFQTDEFSEEERKKFRKEDRRRALNIIEIPEELYYLHPQITRLLTEYDTAGEVINHIISGELIADKVDPTVPPPPSPKEIAQAKSRPPNPSTSYPYQRSQSKFPTLTYAFKKILGNAEKAIDARQVEAEIRALIGKGPISKWEAAVLETLQGKIYADNDSLELLELLKKEAENQITLQEALLRAGQIDRKSPLGPHKNQILDLLRTYDPSTPTPKWVSYALIDMEAVSKNTLQTPQENDTFAHIDWDEEYQDWEDGNTNIPQHASWGDASMHIEGIEFH